MSSERSITDVHAIALADGIDYHSGEMFLPEPQLWLDARRRKLRSFVSHAHTDHMAAHRLSVLSETTERFFRHRSGASPTLALPFHQPRPMGAATIELVPAGHILGSAQLVVTNQAGRRLAYTGDFKLRPSRSAEPGEVVVADTLIMEATYGQPNWRFPATDLLHDQLAAAIARAQARGKTPVVLAYALGKAQEALAILNAHGHRVAVHPTIGALNPLYEAAGRDLGPYHPLDTADCAGQVLLLPVGAQRSVAFRSIPSPYTIFLSGWGLDPRARYRYGVDDIVPLSDHADFDELTDYVARSRPTRVYTVHGAPDFARHLRTQGIEAYHLPDHQPSLFDG